ncbi:MAG: hypothetical protein US68_C0004G0037 [Candidatus Shapirobacteria bacterium GW2011_GWE1_38_10]|uniref:Uncharacterized protein n=1 Tax=Candidatus Shapirobacteria bacterium GW2011_GWE1_38_10 TaxID=1618488 RepID=A0A0G0IHQ3_9BACT|nr:MAG: hypothetical protein US46_C0005G0053 [Candidatus Shapirobacteria bacterium GW2011_GWF2_37_20]KKQ50555.1 MAG: hypothetical protein US68_C0004G0037 [Candidatus Shapirobacteria bacterium GW2011_GWE1_38_10]KKQ64697.1 MAG: hypothetical protein US85_C0005G0045 [Candidatus Shapirobacteria bacterium GW2011_GWF1_38_23]HBP51101.1 hypothetical protein [Candidatus Shapirobacteria bacterium]
MDNEGEIKLEKIRQTVNLEKITTENFVNKWKEIFGEETTVRRERFVNQSGKEISGVKDTIIENVKITPVENLIFLTYQGGVGQADKYIAIDSKEYLMGVQDHDGGEKSFILVHNTENKKTGENRQTTRRFTPARAQTSINQV